MIKSKGTNNFTENTFDKYCWSANTYETPEEIQNFLNEHDIYSKKLKNIRAIGSLFYERLGEMFYFSEEELLSADKLSFAEKRELFRTNDKVIFSYTFDEPLIFEFFDKSSLEILPQYPYGLRMSYCAIPHTMTDGTNHMEVDIGKYLNIVCAHQSIENIEFSRVNLTRELTYYGYKEHKTTPKLGFEISIQLEKCSIVICNSDNNYFTLTIPEVYYFASKARLPRDKSGFKHKQIDIPSCSGYGGSLNYALLSSIEAGKYGDCCHLSYQVFPSLAWDLLDKYYDKSINIDRGYDNRFFDYYYDNRYSIESAKRIGEEMLELVSIAENDPLDERCEKIFPWSVLHDKIKTKEEYLLENRNTIAVEIDFNKRFARKLISMANNTDGFDIISFAGP